jgi:hypothetical protein
MKLEEWWVWKEEDVESVVAVGWWGGRKERQYEACESREEGHRR